jgi:hypothetical protein
MRPSSIPCMLHALPTLSALSDFTFITKNFKFSLFQWWNKDYWDGRWAMITACRGRQGSVEELESAGSQWAFVNVMTNFRLALQMWTS